MIFEQRGMRYNLSLNDSGPNKLIPMTSPNTRFVSPLRYPGGKGKISNFMKLLFLQNNLLGKEYVEVYAGGASVALSLLFEEFASQIHINDLNPSIHAFWDCVLHRTETLCSRISQLRPSVAEWRRQRAVQEARDPDPLDLGVSTFFLNRTTRSGILNGGMIGGKKQDGEWKLGARFHKDELIRRIEKIGRFSTRITLTNLDGAEYLRTVLPSLGGAFVYLDPPYFKKGQDLYQNFYRPEDHEDLAQLIRSVGAHRWMVSYDPSPQILSYYSGLNSIRYTLSYSAATRHQGQEVMFFSPGLKVPRVDTPANLPSREIRTARILTT